MKNTIIVIALFISLGLMVSCGNSNSDAPPEITSVSPTVGAAGTAVVISGTGFSPTPSENSVSFNGTSATVTASTFEELKTVVPDGATSGPIQVSVNGKSAQGPAFSVDNRLNFEGDYESKEYGMNIVQVTNGNTVEDTTRTVTISSDIQIKLVQESMDQIELMDIEEFLEDGLNAVLISTVSLMPDEDVVAEVSGNEFNLKDIDITLSTTNDSTSGELNGEGVLKNGNILFTFEYVIMSGGSELRFSGEVELEKQ